MSFYIGVSNFDSAAPYDAFWQTGDDSDHDHITVCATNGYTFLTTGQGVLVSTPSGRTWDGSTVSGTGLAIDGRYGMRTAKVLWLAAKNAGATEAELAQIQREANDRGAQGFTQTIKTLIQLITHNFSTVVRLPDGGALVPFPWATVPVIPQGWDLGPPSRGDGIVMDAIHCTQPYLPDGPDAPAPGEPPPPAPVPVVPPPPPAPSQGGPAIPPAPSPAEENVAVAPGRSPMSVVQSGVSWGPIAIAAGLIVATVLIVRNLRTEPVKPKPVRSRIARRR